MIDGVEGLKSKFYLLRLVDWKNSADRHVHIECSRRTQEVASEAAKRSNRGSCESGLVEYNVALGYPRGIAGLPLINVERLSGDEVWPIIAFARSGTVRPRANVNRPTTLRANCWRYLPSAQEPANCSLARERAGRNHRRI